MIKGTFHSRKAKEKMSLAKIGNSFSRKNRPQFRSDDAKNGTLHKILDVFLNKREIQVKRGQQVVGKIFARPRNFVSVADLKYIVKPKKVVYV